MTLHAGCSQLIPTIASLANQTAAIWGSQTIAKSFHFMKSQTLRRCYYAYFLPFLFFLLFPSFPNSGSICSSSINPAAEMS